MIDDNHVLDTAARWLAEGRRLGSATVIRTWRSSPRPAGSRLIADETGRFAGSVSGGCVESAVVEAVQAFLAGGEPRVLEFGVSQEVAWGVGLPCGGKIEVFVGPVHAEIVRRWLDSRGGRQVRVLLTDLASGGQRWIDPSAIPEDLHPEERDLIVQRGYQDVRSVVGSDGRRSFVEVLGPPVRLIVVGAVHLAQVLCELARRMDFDIVVVDPRNAFGSEDRFPGVEIVRQWPVEALNRIGLDWRTAVVTLSHDAKVDEPALSTALASDCFYVGALGGKKTQRGRKERLREAGLDDRALSRLHGPVGLDIGALTAPEIALSIMAEIVQDWRGAPSRPDS